MDHHYQHFQDLLPFNSQSRKLILQIVQRKPNSNEDDNSHEIFSQIIDLFNDFRFIREVSL